MSQAIGDPEELARFANELAAYAETLQTETRSIQGRFSNLGDTWRDEKRTEFEEQFNELVARVNQFSETCQECVPYLASLAERLRDYLSA